MTQPLIMERNESGRARAKSPWTATIDEDGEGEDVMDECGSPPFDRKNRTHFSITPVASITKMSVTIR